MFLVSLVLFVMIGILGFLLAFLFEIARVGFELTSSFEYGL